jgi:predicted nucleic acid-binding protein
MIFVDTSAWFAVFSRRDGNHATAMSLIRSFTDELATTDYVIDETLTILLARRERRRAVEFGRRVIEGKWASIVRVESEDFTSAWKDFKQFADKGWSFTDCTSRVVMKRLGIVQAFSFDKHFRQFGTVTVVS